MTIKTIAAAILIAAVAAPALAQTAAPAQAPAFQVIRLGDNQMICEALIGEINALNTQLQTQQAQMSQRAADAASSAMRASRGSTGMNTALSLGSMAASFIPGASLAVAAASQVASTAQMASAQAAQDQAMQDMESLTATMTADSNAMIGPSQRIEHLSEISRNKGC